MNEIDITECKRCKEPIEKGDEYKILHGKWAMHPECYRKVIDSGPDTMR